MYPVSLFYISNTCPGSFTYIKCGAYSLYIGVDLKRGTTA